MNIFATTIQSQDGQNSDTFKMFWCKKNIFCDVLMVKTVIIWSIKAKFLCYFDDQTTDILVIVWRQKSDSDGQIAIFGWYFDVKKEKLLWSFDNKNSDILVIF